MVARRGVHNDAVTDEVLEVNSLKLCGKSVHDICSTLCEMSGTLTFVIIPAGSSKEEEEASQPVVRPASHLVLA